MTGRTEARRSRRDRGLLTLLLLTLVADAPATAAQDAEWNGIRAMTLIERARERRTRAVIDESLRSYRSQARGHVYFYLDRRGSDSRTLVKTDQIALDVLWSAPNLTKQRIIGLRDESRLPNRMRYHLDHLTVVQNEFDDVIRLGDGDEVRDVPHPAAPGSDSIYEFRLADSLTIVLPGAPEPVRAYQLEVRPRDSQRAAIVGSLFVDRATADIVRMTFTFTPSSYVDPRLDYINISLDNSLWEGRYWLPHEQSLEIRRQIPELDFIAGAVILARFRVFDYQLNTEIPVADLMGQRVTALPEAQRRTFPFEAGLYDDLQEAGLTPPPTMAELRAEAARLLGVPNLSGLPAFRLSLGAASDVFRFNRAEGAVLTPGISWEPLPSLRAEVAAGFASGPDHGKAALGLEGGRTNGTRFRVDGWYNRLRDVGVRPGTAGALNSLAALGWGDDYLDIFYASGAGLSVGIPLSQLLQLNASVRSERHRMAQLTRRTAPLSSGSEFRPVRPTDEGWLHAAELSLVRPEPEFAGAGWSGHATLEAGLFDSEPYIRSHAGGEWMRTTADFRTHLRARADAGIAFAGSAAPADDALPSQLHYVLGGRNTLPGYAYRSFAGDAFALAEFEVARDVFWPWIRLRTTAAVGWTEDLREVGEDLSPAPTPDATGSTAMLPPSGRRLHPRLDWGLPTTRGLRPALSLGAGVFYDMLRVDLARGLRDGEWQVIFSITPDLWGVL